MSIIAIVVVLLVIGVLLWAVGQFPIDPTIMRIIRVVVIVLALLYVLQALGLMSGSLHLR